MRKLVSAAALLPILLLTSTAQAQQPHAIVDLIPEYTSALPAEQLIGIHFRLMPGWHIYWINSGDSGQPPSFKWTTPGGYTVGDVRWPLPERINNPHLTDYGYKDDVTFLAPLTRAANTAPADAALALNVRYLICREMCVPEKAQASLKLVNTAPTTPNPLITAAKRNLPQPAPVAWKIGGVLTRDSVVISISGAKTTPKQASFFPLDPQIIDNVAPQAMNRTITGVQLRLLPGSFTLWLKTSDQLASPPKQLRGVLVADGNAYEIAVPLKAGNALPGKEKHP